VKNRVSLRFEITHTLKITKGGAASGCGDEKSGPTRPPLHQSASYQDWNKKSTQEIIDSLNPGNPKTELTTYSDGAIVNGNSRITILKERGVDVDSLPRVEINRVPMDELRIPEIE